MLAIVMQIHSFINELTEETREVTLIRVMKSFRTHTDNFQIKLIRKDTIGIEI